MHGATLTLNCLSWLEGPSDPLKLWVCGVGGWEGGGGGRSTFVCVCFQKWEDLKSGRFSFVKDKDVAKYQMPLPFTSPRTLYTLLCKLCLLNIRQINITVFFNSSKLWYLGAS